jgi:hypothetical protein
MACPGLRDTTDRTVRPLPMCQTCHHWQEQTGPVVVHHAIVDMRSGGALLDCGRRLPAEPLPEAA